MKTVYDVLDPIVNASILAQKKGGKTRRLASSISDKACSTGVSLLIRTYARKPRLVRSRSFYLVAKI